MKKSSKILLLWILGILLCGLAIYYSTKTETNNKSIKIGVVLPLTGDLSNVGEFMRNSLLLDTSNIHYIIEDCQGNPKTATTAVNKLINIDKVTCIVTSLSFLSEAVNPICEKKNIPHFILSFSPTLVEKSNVIQPFISTRLESQAFVDYIKNNNVKSVAFLKHQEPDAIYGFKNIIKPQLQEMNVALYEYDFNNNTVKDFRTEVLKIKQTNPDLLVIQSLAFNIPNIISAIKDYQITIPILGDVNFLDIQDSKTRSLVEGIPFVGVDYVLSKNYNIFEEKYIQKYKKQPFALGGFAYDLGRYLQFYNEQKTKSVIVSVFNKVNDSNLINNFEGSRFNPNGQENVTCVILTYQDNQIQKYNQ